MWLKSKHWIYSLLGNSRCTRFYTRSFSNSNYLFSTSYSHRDSEVMTMIQGLIWNAYSELLVHLRAFSSVMLCMQVLPQANTWLLPNQKLLNYNSLIYWCPFSLLTLRWSFDFYSGIFSTHSLSWENSCFNHLSLVSTIFKSEFNWFSPPKRYSLSFCTLLFLLRAIHRPTFRLYIGPVSSSNFISWQ